VKAVTKYSHHTSTRRYTALWNACAEKSLCPTAAEWS